MREFKILIGLMICYPLLLGTTYVIKEGGLEVGRWEEKDGKDGVEIVENEKQAKNSLNPLSNLPATLVIADFDSGNVPNNVGGSFGAWDKNPNDKTQGCLLSFVADDALRNAHGHAIRLDYDVASPNSPAYNGFWMKLNSVNAQNFNTLNFYAKGDLVKGFPLNLRLDLQDNAAQARYEASALIFSNPVAVEGLSRAWKRFSIPLSKFPNAQNRNDLRELTVIFVSDSTYPKIGAVYIDNVYFSKEG